MGENKVLAISTNHQVEKILESVVALGKLDFDLKAPLLGASEQLDALAEGINMLGEELQSKIILINERETLLKEIHHRVKNNLQIVSSILNLQSKVIADKQIAEKFADCQERIFSMALVHEQLYQSDNLSELEVNTYFAALCNRLERIHNAPNIKLNFISAGKALFLNVDQMIPLGIIANELIINSYKHAFSPDQDGIIHFELNIVGNTLNIELSDNGKGFIKAEDFFNSSSLGLQLVLSLLDQLDANIEFSPAPYQVNIKVEKLRV